MAMSSRRIHRTPPQFTVPDIRAAAARVHPNDANCETWDACFRIDDADGLFEAFPTRGAGFVHWPALRPYDRMKEFAIRDGNGYILAFGRDWPDA